MKPNSIPNTKNQPWGQAFSGSLIHGFSAASRMTTPKSSLRNFLALAGSSLLAASFANAGSGNWAVDNAGNWSTASNWSSNPTVPGTVAGDVIGLNNNISAARAVTIDTTSRTAGTLNIGDSNNSHGFTLAASGGGILTLNNSGSGAQINETGSVTDSITSAITLADSLAITSAGTLNITGGVVNGGNTMTIDGAGMTSFSGTANIIAGSGGIIKNGSGTLSLGWGGTTPVHNYTGTTTLNGGNTQFFGNYAPNSNITLNGGTMSFYFNTGMTRALGVGPTQIQIIGGNSGFNANGNCTVNFSNNASQVTWGSATFNPATLSFQLPTNSVTDRMTFANAIDLNATTRSIAVNGPGEATMSGVIRNLSGTAGLIKTGVGTLALSAANTYNGGTTISAGTLRFDIRNATPATGTITVANGASLGVTVAGSGTTWGGGSGVAGIAGLTSTANSGEGYGGQAGAVVNFDGNSFLNLNVTANVTESNEIGNGSATSIRLIKSGGSTLTLTGNNSYTGGTTLSAGALAIGSANALSSGTLFLNGGTIQSNDATARTISNAVTIGGDFTVGGTGDLTFSNTGASALGATRIITVNSGRNATFAQAFSGSGFGITKAGAGTLTLAGANTYTGVTTVSAGKLVLNDGTVSSSAVTFNASNTSMDVLGGSGVNSTWNTNGGEFKVGDNNFSNIQVRIDGQGTAGTARVIGVSTLTWGRTASNSTLTLTDGGQMNVSGEVRIGNPYYTAAGGANMTIGGGTATSTFTGNSAQAFYIGYGERESSYNNVVTVNSGGVLTSIGNMFLGHVNNAQGAGTAATANRLTVTGTGTASMASVTVGYAQTGDAQGSANANVVEVTSGGQLTTSSGTNYIGRNATASTTTNSNTATVTGTGSTWNAGNQIIYVGHTSNATATSNNNTLSVSSGGTLTNASSLIVGFGTGTETGNRVVLNGGGTISASAITVNAGNTLQFGSGGTTSDLSMTGNITNDGSMVFNLSDTITQGTHFDSAFGGSGSVTQSGTGTLVLNGVNTYTGSTTISAGTLEVNGTGSINSTSGISVATGATFNYSSSTALTRAVAVAGGANFNYSSATPLEVSPTLNGSSPNRAVFASTGPINLALSLDSTFDVLSPGSAPGYMEFQTNQSWGDFSYDWQLNDWSANVAGTNIDQIEITGSLSLSGSTYQLNVLSLKNDNTPGLVGADGGTGFSELDKTWTILTTTEGITGFDANNWTINASGFQDADAGQWSISQVDDSLVLTYLGAAVAPIVNSPTSDSITAISATIGGTASPSINNQNSLITERGVVYSITAINSNPLIDGVGVTKITDADTTGVFTIPITDLAPATNYSFKVYAITSMGTTYTTVATFDTLERAPIVILPTSDSITTTSAILGGTVSSDGGRPIIERGVVYSVTEDNSNPLIDGLEVTKVTTGGTTGVFTIPVTDLPFAPLFSYRAYAINSLGTTYSAVFTFSTPPVPPAVSTPTKTSITSSGATLGGRVVRDNGTTIAERGVVYSITSANSNPLIDGVGVTKVTTTGTTGVFTIPVTGLTHDTTYSFKAYATNGVGTTYTTVSTFLTLPLPPTVILPTSASITSSTATLGGTVSSGNGASITERGVVYSATADNDTPQIDGPGVTKVTTTGTTGIFTVPITGLTFVTEYSYRAYATNSEGTSYTDPITFTTLAGAPTVTTPTSASVTTDAATLGGNVTLDGGAAIIERGVVYSVTATNNNPLIDGVGVTKVTTDGNLGVFAIPITGLVTGTTYSFKAYATNNSDTGYTAVTVINVGVVVPTITATPTVADVATDPVTGVGSATLGGNITQHGAEIIERGVVYSLATVNSNPLIDGNGVTRLIHPNTAGSTGAFTIAATGLSAFQSYRFKAYVTNALGTVYTSIGSFTPPATSPRISSPTATDITTSGATLGGNVTADGGRPVSERGVVYSINTTNANPLFNGSGVTKVNATGTTGVFTKAITGLRPGTTYAYKAFATNATGTNYTTVTTFTTDPVAPTVTLPTVATIAATQALLGGTVSSDGGGAITARGVVYSITATNNNPLLLGAGVSSATATGTTGLFTKAITGLTPGTAYSFKAYATNSSGTSYSAVSTFTTRAGAPVVTTPTDVVDGSVVTLGGNVTSDGGNTITERGVVYVRTSVNTNPRIGVSGVKKVAHSTDNTGVFTVTATASDLEGGKGYTYRAYAINGKGTSYSPTGTFTAPAAAPTVNRPTSGLVGDDSAKLGGRVTRDNGAAITSRGVVYSSSNETPAIGSGTRANSGTDETGVFRLTVTDLTPGTEYFFRAFAINSEGTSYSEVSSFTTKTARPTLTTTAADMDLVTTTTATLEGNVSSDGGANITERGVVYSITSVNSSPKTGSNGVVKRTQSGTIGAISRSVTGLKPNTLYSFRVYAINSKGTSYGTVRTFRTDAAP
jgi:autotransporter-associated beta strand protein